MPANQIIILFVDFISIATDTNYVSTNIMFGEWVNGHSSYAENAWTIH